MTAQAVLERVQVVAPAAAADAPATFPKCLVRNAERFGDRVAFRE